MSNINRERIISEFSEGLKRILLDELVGVVSYGSPKGEDIDICVVSDTQQKNAEITRLRESLEETYGVKLDVLNLPPHIFFDALSRMAGQIPSLQNQLNIIYGDNTFQQNVSLAIQNYKEAKPLDLCDYKV